MWNDAEIFGDDEEKNLLHKPSATILSYPLITCGEFTSKGAFKNLTGSEEENKLWKKLSLEYRVDKNTLPTFL